MDNASSQIIVEKALLLPNNGPWLVAQLHHSGVNRDEADEAAVTYATRSGSAVETVLGILDKAYQKPAKKPQAVVAPSLQIHMALGIAREDLCRQSARKTARR